MRKIAIVGSSMSSCDLAPFADESWEIWGLAWRGLPRATRLFEIHNPARWPKYEGPDYLDRLKALTVPLYVRAPIEGLPDAKLYPIEAVANHFALADRNADIFTSSIAYLLALAIYEAPDRIGIWGVDMNAEEEWSYQRPATEFLVGVALGQGIAVEIAPQSSLCRANFVYGADAEAPVGRAAGITEDVLQSRIAKYESLRREAQARINAEVANMQSLEGCLGEARALLDLVKHYNRGGVIPSLPDPEPASS